jgi:hypothetical protein
MISSAFSRARSKIGKWGQGENAIKSALDALCGSYESRADLIALFLLFLLEMDDLG